MLFFLAFSLLGPKFLSAAPKEISLQDLAPPKIKAGTPAKVQVRESVVQLGDLKFKRVEYKGESFYLRLQSKEAISAPNKTENEESSTLVKDEDRECLKNLPYGEEHALVLAEVKVTTVASLYLEGLRNKCRSFDLRRESDGEAGLKLRTSRSSDVRLGVDAAPGAGLTPKASFNLGF
ncbi:MAG: hypothetical protein ACXVBE_02030 [Bdellovibrionota bacterium]